MTYPQTPRPGPPPGGFRPGPPPGRGPMPASGEPQRYAEPAATAVDRDGPPSALDRRDPAGTGDAGEIRETGHPAVDAVVRSLANAARLAPAEQIAEYEAAHQVLQETLASIDG